MAAKSTHYRSLDVPNMAVCRRYNARNLTDRLVKVTCSLCLNQVALNDVAARLVPEPAPLH